VIIFTDVSGTHSQMVNYQTYTQPTAHLSFITTADGQRKQIRTDRISAVIPTPSSDVAPSSDQIQEYMDECDLAASRNPKFADRLLRLKNVWAKRLLLAQQQEAALAEKKRQEEFEAQKREVALAEQRQQEEIEVQKKKPLWQSKDGRLKREPPLILRTSTHTSSSEVIRPLYLVTFECES
jgi:hypothetical protein